LVRGQAAVAVLIVLMMVVVVLGNGVGNVHAAGLSLDGAASNTCTGSFSSVTCSVTLTTSNSNDIIIAIANGQCTENGITLGTPTGSGLSFTLRNSGNHLSGIATFTVGEWWALATLVLSSETITITESNGI